MYYLHIKTKFPFYLLQAYCSSCELIAVSALAVVFLYISHTARYYGKFIFFMVGSTIFAALLPPFGLLKYPVKDYRIAL